MLLLDLVMTIDTCSVSISISVFIVIIVIVFFLLLTSRIVFMRSILYTYLYY